MFERKTVPGTFLAPLILRDTLIQRVKLELFNPISIKDRPIKQIIAGEAAGIAGQTN